MDDAEQVRLVDIQKSSPEFKKIEKMFMSTANGTVNSVIKVICVCVRACVHACVRTCVRACI